MLSITSSTIPISSSSSSSGSPDHQRLLILQLPGSSPSRRGSKPNPLLGPMSSAFESHRPYFDRRAGAVLRGRGKGRRAGTLGRQGWSRSCWASGRVEHGQDCRVADISIFTGRRMELHLTRSQLSPSLQIPYHIFKKTHLFPRMDESRETLNRTQILVPVETKTDTAALNSSSIKICISLRNLSQTSSCSQGQGKE